MFLFMFLYRHPFLSLVKAKRKSVNKNLLLPFSQKRKGDTLFCFGSIIWNDITLHCIMWHKIILHFFSSYHIKKGWAVSSESVYARFVRTYERPRHVNVKFSRVAHFIQVRFFYYFSFYKRNKARAINNKLEIRKIKASFIMVLK